ncbi:MAG TPA: hypothetical protein PLP61_10035 [Nocardioides sp.]|uniref:hypothetical protein n=1 Tax=Nocardioides sp. TaxID=35761 RepID=UPI002CAABC2D|nr:hypothetical protein [Nocardioides sp.]HQR27366.1 hypothetical protein [Nocardioides sp.]
MTWLHDYWLEILGWGGSALLVVSLLQTRVLRFRVLNLIAGMLLVVYNGILGVWPMAGVNLVLSGINIWFIVKLWSQRHDERVFEVLEVDPSDEYLRHVLRVHGADILHFQPDFVWDPGAPDEHAFLVTRGDETVGVVLLQADGAVARIRLDYVTPRFRDFSPGEFVWRRSGLLRGEGFTRVVTPETMVNPYYDRVGFRREGQSYVLDL